MRSVSRLAVTAALALAATDATAQTAVGPTRIRYIVDDVPAAVDFYTHKLGFKLDVQSGRFFAALSRYGVQLLISPAKGPGGASQPMPNGERPTPGGGWNRIVLYTADLKGDVARLKKDGVHLRNDIVVGLGGDEVLLDDPSGNVVELFQPTYAAAPLR